MVDGFHWTKVTSKQLRFIYEAVTLQPTPQRMRELATMIDERMAGLFGASNRPGQPKQSPLCIAEPGAPDNVHHNKA